MKGFLIFALSASSIFCTGQKTASLYLAHCDSLFYMEGESFDAKKIKSGKMKDSAFVEEVFSHISPTTHTILFKPYTDLCITGDGMLPIIIDWKKFLVSKGFSDKPITTDSIEDAYFGNISIIKYISNLSESKNDWPPPPPPPPSVEIIITEDGKPIPGTNEDALYIKAKGAVTFLLSGKNMIYYYEGIFNGILRKTNFNDVGKLLKQYKNKFPAKDLVILIKSDTESSFKNTVDMLDEIVTNKIQRGHYAEIDITDKEIESINNFKEN